MSLSIDRFSEFFRALYQDKQGKPIDPFPWQARLARHRAAQAPCPDARHRPDARGFAWKQWWSIPPRIGVRSRFPGSRYRFP